MSGALRYEWRRISSVRATWILVACGIVLSTAFAFLFRAAIGSAAGADDGAPTLNLTLTENVGASTTNLIVLVLLGTIAAQAFGQEYRHGTIRLTLTEFPKRTPIFVAKVVVCCVVILVAFFISTAIAYAVLAGNSQIINDGLGSFFGYLLRASAYLVGFCLVVFAVTVLTRILALGVIIPFAFAAVAEPLLGTLIGQYVSWVPKALPFTSGADFVNGNDVFRNGLVFGAWVVVLTIAGYIVFERRDA